MKLNELTGYVIREAIEIHKILGPGLLESVYKECLYASLKDAGILVDREVAVPVIFKQQQLGCGFRIDLLVEKRLVIEIKSVEGLNDLHLAQVLTYLKLGNFNLGLLINFNVLFLKNGLRRVVNNFQEG